MFANTFGTHQNVECGLVCIIKPPNEYDPIKTSPIPLEHVSIQASIVHAVAQVEVTQVYVNKEEQPIEAIYYFPVDSNGGITHFHAELEGKTIKGVVKAEEEAKAVYEKAVQEQKSAFLVESNKPDIFKVRVGYLKPGCQVKIVIGYVSEVKNEKGSNALRFCIPTTVSPRYIPNTDTDDKSLDLKNMRFSIDTPAPLTIKVNAAIQGEIKSIESTTHTIQVTSKGPILGKQAWTSAVVELVGKTTDMDRDFVVNIVPQDVHIPRLYQEKADDSTVFMAHLIPSFNLDDQKVELIFVLDRSGSMQGQSIGLAKKALKLFLHSLPMDCYFNVVGFGSTFEFLFPESVKYDDGSLKKALSHAERLKADLGGTEILEPLQEVFNKKVIDGYLRQIFVITDGEVSDTEDVVGFVSSHSHTSRVFSLGIGDGASHDLVEGLASAGGGTAVFATYNEAIDNKVLQQLKNGIQPSLTDIKITFTGFTEPSVATPSPVVQVTRVTRSSINKEKTLLGYGKPINSGETMPDVEQEFIQVPEKVPPIFDGSALVVFGAFPSRTPMEVCISAESPDGPLSLKIAVQPDGNQELGSTGMLHKLMSIKLVNELQLKLTRVSYSQTHGLKKSDKHTFDQQTKSLKSDIVKIACKEGIASKFTSFVAVDTESNQTSEDNWCMQSRYVPSQFSHGWHGGNYGGQILYGSAMARCAPLTGGGRYPLKTCAARKSAPATGGSLVRRCAPATGGGPARRRALATRAVRRGAPTTSACLRSRGVARKSAPATIAQLSDEEEESVEEDSDESDQSDRVEPMEIVNSDADRLHSLIGMQSFDGSFTLDEKFCKLLGLKIGTVKTEMKKNGWDEKTYATALAVSYFSEKLQTLKGSWELVALKATKWLQKFAGPTYNSIIEAAATYIKSV